MKKAIVASVLGIAASGIAAYGQGQVIFNNYSSTTYAADQVLWGANSGHTSGTAVNTASVEVQLFWALGNLTSDTASQFLAVANAGVTANISTTANQTSPYYGVGAGGYFAGPVQTLAGWSSGAVTFLIEGWDTTTGATYAASTVNGLSALWSETGATAGNNGIQPTSLPPEYFAASPGLVLTGSPVPEPTTMALGGLGLAALMFFRRKNV